LASHVGALKPSSLVSEGPLPFNVSPFLLLLL
jgi:hypothetical protein